MIISCILTGIIIYQTFKKLDQYSVHSYKDFLIKINSHTKVNKLLGGIVCLFLLISYYIMVAGFCAYFKQEWQIPIMVSSSILAILCYATFRKDIQGVIRINNILMPILILIVMYLGIKNISYTSNYFSKLMEQQVLENFGIHWLISSILYASYNSILLIPILIELKPYINTKEKMKKTSILCSSILTVLGSCLYSLLLRGGEYAKQLELPILQIVKEFGKIVPWIYGLVIVAAIFTSAISAGYGFLNSTNQKQKRYQHYALVLCLSSIFVAPIGFSKLVNLWYPFFGVLGLIQILYLIKRKT